MIPPRWAHQTTALQKMLPLAGGGLWMSMGTGKSRVVVDLIRERQHRTVLILAPKSACAVWPREFTKYMPEPHSCLVLDSGTVASKTKRAQALLDSTDLAGTTTVVVMNYETAWRPPMRPFLLARQWDLVVCDESHKIKAPDGRASKFCALLRQRARHRLCLTGTPLPHSPLDAYAQYRFLDPSIFGSSFHAFRNTYARFGGYGGKQVTTWIRQGELAEKMYNVAFRVEADDVLDLPPLLEQERLCTLTPGGARVYRDIERRFVADVADGEVTTSNVLTRLLRLSQVAQGYVRNDDGTDVEVDTSKRELLAELLDGLPVREPVVVFCRFRHDLDVVRATAEAQGRVYRELSGRVNQQQAWQYEGDGDVIGVQVQAGGAGIDLTRAAYCIFYSVSFSLGEFDQCRARAYRPGQTRHTFFFHLLAEDTMDGVIYRALSARRDIVEAVMNWSKAQTEEAA